MTPDVVSVSFEERVRQLMVAGVGYYPMRFRLWVDGYGSYNKIDRKLRKMIQENSDVFPLPLRDLCKLKARGARGGEESK